MPVSNASAFYSRGRQIAGYSATDALLQSRHTNSNVTVKRTPGFLSVSNSKVVPDHKLPGWRQKSIPTAVKTSQISLQGFSNLGNTCGVT
ncbi:ubiquitin carboxyl-terminal hydrolase 37-like [Asterias rubens]|uniref:ubiquitin carboxyl-terminal hydrolase 37-like n=1 Tax=Asterias rubens TaxID=7604 RepID=UPI0014550909|nr:ubiquitin carboxyl-terminal hydrolase 37-like [Asterias rubens]